MKQTLKSILVIAQVQNEDELDVREVAVRIQPSQVSSNLLDEILERALPELNDDSDYCPYCSTFRC